MGAIGLMSVVTLIINVTAVWVASLTGWWVILEKGWPMELFLVSLALCIVMTILDSIWMLIPVGIFLGNGMLFSYSALTGNWDHWVFLWALELLLVVGTIFLTIWLAGLKNGSRQLSRLLGWVLAAVAAAWAIMVPLMALFMPN